MPKINKYYLVIPFEIIFLFFLLIVLPTVFLKEKPGISQTSFENILPLDINHSYIQSFTANRNNLNSVSLLLKNPAIKSTDMLYVEVQDSNYQVLQSFSISGRAVEDPGWINFKFSPINSKKDNIFYLKISSDSPTDDLLYIYGDRNTNNINFKTTFKASNIKESFSDNLNQQILNFKSRNMFQGGLYLFTIILINILILI